jgi:probable O-glycosylation ligase (exosortase A-associated)
MQYLIALALAIIALITFSRPFVGLLGLLAINIINPGELYPLIDSIHAERLMAIVVLISFLLNHKTKFPPITRQVLMLWGTMFLSIAFSVWRSATLSNSFGFGRTVIYHVLLANLVTSARRLKAFIVVFVLLIGYLSVSTYFGGSIHHAMGVDRLIGSTSSSNDANALGATLVSALPLAVLLITSKQMGGWRYVAGAVCSFCVFSIVFTASRSSFLALIVLTVAGAAWSNKRMLLIPTGAVLLLVVWVLMPAQYKDRYRTVESLQNDASYQHRVVAWHCAIQMFEDSPITGIGAGVFAVAAGTKYWPSLPGHRRAWLQPHSLYFQIISELGLLGTIAFGSLIFNIFRSNARTGRELSAVSDVPRWLQRVPVACSFSMFALLFLGYSAHSLYRSTWYMLAGITAATVNLAAQYTKANHFVYDPEPETEAKQTETETEAEQTETETETALG